jgi:hypothetical protein
MVPAAYVVLGSLPLTPNGKVDRKGLPAPDEGALSMKEYEAPQGEIEEMLAQIWRELLKVERVGRHDNFFELGGHSLLATRLVSQIRQTLKLEVALREVFEHASVSELGLKLQQSQQLALPPIEVGSRSGKLPVSYAQQRLWFIDQLESNASRAYHIRGSMRLQGVLDEKALRGALDTLVERHEALRTVFRSVDGEPVQVIRSGESFALRYRDVSGYEQERREEQVKDELREEGAEGFDLSAGPLIRGRLLKVSEEEHVLLITMHHIVSDGWSMGVFFAELGALYAAYREGKHSPLAALPIQYADYAQWQRQWLQGEVLQEQLGYWKEQLAGAPQLIELPTDQVRPAQPSYAGAAVAVVLGEQLSRQLKELSQREGLTLFMTLYAGFALLLSKLSGQEDVVIGTPIANRQRVEVEGLIGFFVNTMALRARLEGNPTVKELLQQV